MMDQPKVPMDKGSTNGPKKDRHLWGSFANRLMPPYRRAKDDQEAGGEKARILAEATRKAERTLDKARQEAEAEKARLLAEATWEAKRKAKQETEGEKSRILAEAK